MSHSWPQVLALYSYCILIFVTNFLRFLSKGNMFDTWCLHDVKKFLCQIKGKVTWTIITFPKFNDDENMPFLWYFLSAMIAGRNLKCTNEANMLYMWSICGNVTGNWCVQFMYEMLVLKFLAYFLHGPR